MKKVLLAYILIFSSLCFGNDNETLLKNTYDNAYANAAINCEYFYFRDVPRIETISQTYSQSLGATAQYRVNDKIISIGITSGGNNGIVSFQVNGETFNASLKSRGDSKEINHIQLDLSHLSSSQASIADSIKLSDMDCSIDIGMENHFKLYEEKVHINMHPHINYDLDGESVPGMLRELAKPVQQLMLIDDSPNNRFRALGTNFNNFIINGVLGLRPSTYAPPAFQIPEAIPMKLSQAGHNRFSLTMPHHEITYTGGNHNFCILNNTRRVLHGFMENSNSRSIIFKFPLDAIVVQKKTWLKDGSFSGRALRGTNMLSNVFRNMRSKNVKKYLDAYYSYFRWDYLAEKKYFYGTATFKQVLNGRYERVETVQGLGTGHIDITFDYLD